MDAIPDPALAVTAQPIDWTRRHGKCARPFAFPFVNPSKPCPVR